MAWKNVREMDLDHIWNTDLLHIVDLPRHISKRHNKPLRHNNTTLSTNNPRPVLKTYEYDNPGFQDLRLYYRAAIKGSVSLKLFQASLLFVDGELFQNYATENVLKMFTCSAFFGNFYVFEIQVA